MHRGYTVWPQYLKNKKTRSTDCAAAVLSYIDTSRSELFTVCKNKIHHSDSEYIHFTGWEMSPRCHLLLSHS